jgi:hypothetical protein
LDGYQARLAQNLVTGGTAIIIMSPGKEFRKVGSGTFPSLPGPNP